MNIFVLDKSPTLAAQNLCDKHVVKMCLESAQLLSIAHRFLDGEDAPKECYRLTHANHPCSKWVREVDQNYLWLWEHFKAQNEEYGFRYGKVHLSWRKLGEILKNPPKNIKNGSLMPFAQCMPPQYKRIDPVAAYRSYYLGEKRNILRWTKRSTPDWTKHKKTS